MPDTSNALDNKRIIEISVEVAVRLAIVGLLVVWCLKIFTPFIIPMMWGTIIAVALAPLFRRLTAFVGGKRGIAAALFTLAAIVLIIVPTFRIADSVVRSSLELADRAEAGELTVPEPRESVRERTRGIGLMANK